MTNTLPNNIIKIVPTPIGSGKTHAIVMHVASKIEHAKHNRTTSEKFIIACPDTTMINEVADMLTVEFESRRLDVNTIHQCYRKPTGTFNQSIKTQIKTSAIAINKCGAGVLLITHAAKRDITNLDIPELNPAEWELFFDEYFNDGVLTATFNLSQNGKNLFPKIFDVHQSKYSSLLYELSVNNSYTCVNTEDEINVTYIKQIIDIIKANGKVFVSCNAYDNMINRNKSKVSFVGWYPPDILTKYKSVTITSANFEQSLLRCIWEQFYQIDFKLDIPVLSNLRYSEHFNGRFLKIYFYLADERNTTYARQRLQEFPKVLNIFFEKLLSTVKPLISYNQSDKKTVTEILKKYNGDIRTLSPAAVGSNEHTDTTGIACVFSSNYTLSVISILKHLGISDKYFYDRNDRTTYQTVGRIALRNPYYYDDVAVYVLDEYSATTISNWFVGCELYHIQLTKLKYKVVPVNQSRRKPLPFANRRKKIILRELVSEYGVEINENVDMLANIEPVPDCTRPSVLDEIEPNSYKFVSLLKKLHTNNITYKKTLLVYPTAYKYKKYQVSPYLFMDFNRTNMTPDDIIDVYTELNIPVVLYNSFLNSQQMNSYQAVCFTFDHMNSELYYQRFMTILDYFESKGWTIHDKTNGNYSGIDLTKAYLKKWFYVPTTIYGNEDFSFLKTNFKTSRVMRRIANHMSI